MIFKEQINIGDTVYFIAGYGTFHYEQVFSITQTEEGLSYRVKGLSKDFKASEVYKDVNKFKEFLIEKETKEFNTKKSHYEYEVKRILAGTVISFLSDL